MDTSPMHVTRWGDTGPVVVMVHGSAQGSRADGGRHFARQERLASRGWQILVPDRPGHGLSPAPGRPDDAHEDGRLVAELLGSGSHLVGHSFGGAVALAAAAQRPDVVRSLTIIEPALQRFAMRDPAVRKFGFSAIKTLKFTRDDTKRAIKFSQLLRIPPEMRDDDGRPADLAAMGKGLAALRLPSKSDVSRQLDTIAEHRIPFVVVTGGWSPAFEAIGATAAERGGGTHVVIESDHHFPNLVSEEFNDLLDTLMRSADAAHEPS
jgi:pimeloyl-ACP methyl ester carboxylesterase